jgi:hypothetical protein
MESAQAADPQTFGSKLQQIQKLAENRSDRIRLTGPYTDSTGHRKHQPPS